MPVALDKVITDVPVTTFQPAQSADLSQCKLPRACCDSDMCSDSQSPKDSSWCDSDNENQPAEDIEIDEDTFQKGDQYSRQITGGPSASMMSVEYPEAFAEIVCLAPGEGQKPLYIFTDEHFESMTSFRMVEDAFLTKDLANLPIRNTSIKDC